MTNITTRLLHATILGLSIALITFAVPGGASNAATVSQAPRATTSLPTTMVDVTLSDNMRISLDKTAVQPGYVTFIVNNAGAATHEFVVLRTDLAADALPANPEEAGKAVEDIHMGETGDMPAGADFSSLTLALGPGHYVVLCNEPGHYMAGMRADFTVEPTLVNVTLKDDMTIALDKNVVYAGQVVFAVTNAGTITHEFVVLDTNASPADIPADPDEIGKISEATNIGETGDIPAGRFSGLGITLGPGLYQVICNEVGHFMAGMHFQLLVLPDPGSDEPTE